MVLVIFFDLIFQLGDSAGVIVPAGIGYKNVVWHGFESTYHFKIKIILIAFINKQKF